MSMESNTPGRLPHGPVAQSGPRGPITTAKQPLPVLATLRFLDGLDLDVPAIATAWTKDSVQVVWEQPNIGLSREWIPAHDVLRGRAAINRILDRGSGRS